MLTDHELQWVPPAVQSFDGLVSQLETISKGLTRPVDLMLETKHQTIVVDLLQVYNKMYKDDDTFAIKMKHLATMLFVRHQIQRLETLQRKTLERVAQMSNEKKAEPAAAVVVVQARFFLDGKLLEHSDQYAILGSTTLKACKTPSFKSYPWTMVTKHTTAGELKLVVGNTVASIGHLKPNDELFFYARSH